jgi:O-antigen/teichoic acid export membrane protein
VSLIRLQRFDTSTAEGRSLERYRRVGLTALASAVAKGLNVVTLLVTVPLTLHYLGPERFGLWMTISSLVGMLCFADLGMNAALKTLLAEADGREDRREARRLITSAYLALSVIALAVLGAVGVAYPFLSWGRLYNVQDAQALGEAGPATAIVAACFLLNIPLGLINQIQAGFQEGFANAFWQGVGNLLGLVGVITAVRVEAGLPWLALAVSGGPLLACLLNSAAFFRLRHAELLPRWLDASWEETCLVVRAGLLYFVLAVAVALTFYADNLVLAHTLGPDAVTEYAVTVRLFSPVPLLCGFLMNPFWPAYSEALARGERDWVKRTFFRTLWISISLSAGLSLILVLGQKWLLRWWLGEGFQMPLSLTAGMACWTVLSAAAGAVAMLLNGARVIAYQVVISLLVAAGTLVAKLVLTGPFGPTGIVMGNLLGYSVFWLLPLIFFLPGLWDRVAARRQAEGVHA